MKVRSSIKKIDKDDQIVKRRGRLYVINKKKPRNKQRQGWFHYRLAIVFMGFSLLALTAIFGLIFTGLLLIIFSLWENIWKLLGQIIVILIR